MKAPNCCDAMRRELGSVIVHETSTERKDKFCDRYVDVDGVKTVGDEATWLETYCDRSTDYYRELGDYASLGSEWTRIRFCPWCGTEIDSREKL